MGWQRLGSPKRTSHSYCALYNAFKQCEEFKKILSMHNSYISNLFYYGYSLHVTLLVDHLLAALNDSSDTTDRLLVV
jgi:hypothetical protein